MDRRDRERLREDIRAEERASGLFGMVIAVVGMLVAVVGDLSPGEVGPAGPAGLVLGALGYVLGARRLGTAAVVLSAAEILVGLLVG